MRKKIFEWLIKKCLPGYHIHQNPTHNKSEFNPPLPDFTVDAEREEKNVSS